jgi:hypothetical protein
MLFNFIRNLLLQTLWTPSTGCPPAAMVPSCWLLLYVHRTPALQYQSHLPYLYQPNDICKGEASCTPEVVLRWASGVNREFLPFLDTHSDWEIPPPNPLLNLICVSNESNTKALLSTDHDFKLWLLTLVAPLFASGEILILNMSLEVIQYSLLTAPEGIETLWKRSRGY